jgi:hypothetical protein
MDYIKKSHFFSKLEYLPSVGASGGLITNWNATLLTSVLDFKNEFSIFVRFSSNLTNESWILTRSMPL